MKTPPVASLEKSKELAKFVRLETYFCWQAYKTIDGSTTKFEPVIYRKNLDENVIQIFAPLAEELSDYVYSIRKDSFFIYHNAGMYLLQYNMDQGNYNNQKLSECLIDYIIENKLIEVEDGV